MKLLLIILSFIIVEKTFSQTTMVTLQDVANKIKNSNFKVLENAQRVYQAKETITFSKRNLLPKLNLWNVMKLPIDWTSAIDIVQDIAPFLVPNNWFRLQQNKSLYLAQEEQYRALWANEVMTAKLLFLNTLRDKSFLDVLETQKKQISDLVKIVKTRQLVGNVDPQVASFLQIRELEVKEDVRVLKRLVFEEKKALSYLMGVDQEEDIELENVELPKVEDLDAISYSTFIFRAIEISPELRQYEYLKDALKKVKKEISFSFLGSSTTARGASGGVFNNIPLQDGLGFGAGASLRIRKSEEFILTLNSDATKEVIKKNLYNLVYNFNSLVGNIDSQNERFYLAASNYRRIKSRLILGIDFDPYEILTSIDNLADASISLSNYQYEVVTSMEKLKRTIFNGDYSMNEVMLESLLKEVQ